MIYPCCCSYLLVRGSLPLAFAGLVGLNLVTPAVGLTSGKGFLYSVKKPLVLTATDRKDIEVLLVFR